MTPLMKRYAYTMMMALAGFLASCGEEKKEDVNAGVATSNEEQAKPAGELEDIRIEIETSKGKIEATIYAAKVPMTAANYLNLAKRGYYDGLTFHRVIPNFMIQGGDPQGTGMGGPGYKFGDEIVAELQHDGPGVFSMANAGPGTNGSQFFITHKATPWLNGKHTVYGKVTEGQDIVDTIVKGDIIKSIKILDSTDALFESQKANIDTWNKVLDAR